MVVAEQLFDSDLTFVNMSAASPAELFGGLSEALLGRGLVTPDWLAGVTAREESYPTGLKTPAFDIAIPHTDPVYIVRPYIAVIKPAEPVPFACMGGIAGAAQARLIFNLGITGDGGQVEVLQRLMSIFMDERISHKLLAATTPDELVGRIIEVF